MPTNTRHGGRHAKTRFVEVCRRHGARGAVRPTGARGGGTIKLGVVGAKTGPLAPGAAATHFPPWRLWAHEINEAGGLRLKDGARKVELIEYDDHTQPPEAIKAIERLATVDKADWIVGLYSTGFNIAAVPTFTKLGYPQIAVACVTDLGEQLVKKNPRLFFANGTITQYSSTAIDVLKKLKDAGQLGSRVALVNVADEFGIEAANISKKLLPAAGFEISTTNPTRSAPRITRR
jgi:branched-chain amino acid transport system substrate-binding protein